MSNIRIQTFLANASMSERRRFITLVRMQRLNPQDAQRVIERERNRAAIGATDLREIQRAQTNKRTVVGSLGALV